MTDSLWQNRNFLLVWLGNLISTLGNGFYQIALSWWMLDTTGSATLASSVLALQGLIGVLVSPFAGTLADRVDRRQLMLVTDLIRAVAVLPLLYFMYQGTLTPALIFATATVLALAANLFIPAFTASRVMLVTKEQLPQATGLMQGSQQIAMLLGPLLGGVVLAFIGPFGAIAVDFFGYLISALCIFLARFPSPRRTEANNFWQDLREGFAYLIQDPFLRAMGLLSAGLNLVAGPLLVMPMAMAKQTLGVSQLQFGLVEASIPLGIGVGAVLLPVLSRRLGQTRSVMVGLLPMGLVVALIGLTRSLPTFLATLVLLGIFLGVLNIGMSVILQERIPADKQGRAFGLVSTLAGALMPAGMAMGGPLADTLTPPVALIYLGLLFFVVSFGVFKVPGITQGRPKPAETQEAST